MGASDGFDSANPQSTILLPMLGSMNEAFIHQLKAKVRRGMDDAFRRGDNIQPPGVGYRLVDVKDSAGNLVITHKGTPLSSMRPPTAATRATNYPRSTSTASDGIPCHGADGPREERFQGGL